jgi:hypothetical protein
MDHKGSSFLTGCVATNTVYFFAKELDSRTAEGFQNSTFFALNEKDWGQYPNDVGWACVAMATLKPAGATRTVLAIGVHGEWWELQPATRSIQTGTMEGVRGHLRALKAIGESFYAAGMGRRVHRRIGPGQWEAIWAQAPGPSDTVVGFEDIDGFGEDEIYAAGWQGEIWLRQSEKWTRLDSPVSANLNAVCCASDGMVYVVGDTGAMLKGRGDTWEIIDTGRHENLMDVSEYNGQIYVVTDFRILKLVDGVLVLADNFDEDNDRPLNCLFLERGSGALLSIAPKDVMKLNNGTWRRVA